MARRKQIEITFIFSVINLLLLNGGCSSSKTTDSFYYTTDFVQSGDIILRKSYGLISEIVVAELHDTLNVSHCGIIVKDNANDFRVVHSLSEKVSDTDGVQISELKDFMADSRFETVKVVRFIQDKNGKIAQKALQYLALKIPFDEQFNSKDTTALFCSELPIQIIHSIYGIDISNGASKPKFSVFLNPKYFRRIQFIKKEAVSKARRTQI